MPAGSEFEFARRQALAWVVVVTKPGQETRAKQNLEAQGFEVYLPLKLYMNKRKEMCSVPFLPRYLFARIDVREDRWRRVWSTFGCQGMLGAQPNKPPYGVRDFVIERIQQQEEAGYIRMLGEGAKLAQTFQEGEIVRVAGSPLEALFVEQVDARRAVILVSLLGRDSRHTVDIAKLRSTVLG